jgi:hypothetical protein
MSKKEVICPYYSSYGYRGCTIGCSCGGVLFQCFPKHAIVQSKPQKEIDIGVCWPNVIFLVVLSLLIFFAALTCIIGTRKVALDMRFQMEQDHLMKEAQKAAYDVDAPIKYAPSRSPIVSEQGIIHDGSFLTGTVIVQ